jgi:hypothetical protein
MGTSTEELSSDIAQTRQSLAQDVDALQDKVSPAAIMERRKAAVRGRLSTARDRVMGGGQDAVQGVSGARSGAGEAIEQRVEGSPLAAGLVAFGAGLVIAGLIPASKVEAQGAQRLQEAVKEHGQPVIDEARSAAQQVGEQLKDKAAEAASEVKASAQESTERVKEEAPTSSSTGDGFTSGPRV